MKQLFTLAGFLIFYGTWAQNGFYNTNKISKIEITFNESNWDRILDSIKPSDTYWKAKSVRVNDSLFTNIGVKYKGNSSYDSTYKKNPLHVVLDEYTSQNYYGITDIKLSNEYYDPSMIREVISYQALQQYMDAPQCNFAVVYVNGKYMGIYSSTENIGKTFVSTHFYSKKTNTFFKCNPPVLNPSVSTKCNLKYITADSTSYQDFYELKSSTGWSDLVKLCDSVTNAPVSMARNLNTDRWIWMLAFNNLFLNFDSYSGAFSQNYYLFKDDNGAFNPIVWDMNMSLGGFPFVGSGAGSMGTLSISQMQQLTPDLHSTDDYWPVIKTILNDPLYRHMYYAHLKTMTQEMIGSGWLNNEAAALQALIDTAVLNDTCKFYSYANFKAALTTNINAGTYQVPGISSIMNARNTYLQSLPEFTATQPSIKPVSAAVVSGNLTVKVNVTDASTVYLGFRNATKNRFTRILMYDDGAHNDGASGDQVYGVTVAAADTVQFYIYADNANAGAFLPARAEHVYFKTGTFTGLPPVCTQFNSLQVYPNPARDELFVYTSEGYTYKISDMAANECLRGTLTSSQGVIDVSSLRAGMYVAEVCTAGGTVSRQKFIKQ